MYPSDFSFDAAFNYVIKNETKEGHIDEITQKASDAGGITKYGISLRFLKSIPFERLKKYSIYADEIGSQDIIDLTFDQAKAIYRGEFWENAPFSKIIVGSVCNYIFDMAVNIGIHPAVKCAQRACWPVMQCRRILDDDGIMGNETLDKINQSGTYLRLTLQSERAAYYRLIVEHNENQRENLEGWLNRAYR